MMTDHNRTYSQRGDDYLLEAQRVCEEDKREYDKPAPRCPYCGEEMRENGSISHRWYICPYCLSAGPRKIIDMTGDPNEELAVVDATQKAREATMKHWEEPNRVLTLKELNAYNGFVWCEYRGYANDSDPGYVENGTLSVDGDSLSWQGSQSGYGKYWRCWLRKPTQKEMEETPWESP